MGQLAGLRHDKLYQNSW